MPKDHYVSQVHLKNFYSPKLIHRMWAIRKSDLKKFTPDASSVCRISDGSTNTYLDRVRGVEDFLKRVEPRYNRAVTDLSSGSFADDSISTIAGFVAYVSTCSPTAMRLNDDPIRRQVERVTSILATNGVFPPPPRELGFESASEALAASTLTIKTKFSQAIGICGIEQVAKRLASYHWEIIHNPFSDSAFFTSDYPVAIESSEDPRILNKVVPLTPTLAVRIRPHFRRPSDDVDESSFRGTSRVATKQEVIKINRLLVGCAEDLVFFRDNHPWIPKFVKKHREFRVESVSDQLPSGRGVTTISRLRLKTKGPAVGS